jgi:hypothetical protein
MSGPVIPMPPAYPPTVHLVVPEAPAALELDVEPDAPTDRPWSGITWRVGHNAACFGVALFPIPGSSDSLTDAWRAALHTCAREQGAPTAFGLAVLGTGIVVLLDRYRGSWLTRVLLYAAALGVLTTPDAVLGLLQLLTGATS